jgi:hypothetical protein
VLICRNEEPSGVGARCTGARCSAVCLTVLRSSGLDTKQHSLQSPAQILKFRGSRCVKGLHTAPRQHQTKATGLVTQRSISLTTLIFISLRARVRAAVRCCTNTPLLRVLAASAMFSDSTARVCATLQRAAALQQQQQQLAT